MGSYILHPTGTVSRTGTWNVTGSTEASALADTDNRTTYVTPATSGEQTLTLAIANATGTIPGGEIITRVQAFVEYYDTRTGLTSTSTFPASVGLNVGSNPVVYGAYYREQASGAYTTFTGLSHSLVPGRPDLHWTFAYADDIRLTIKSQAFRNYYEAWVVVTTISAGTLSVTGPNVTPTTNRGPVVTWAFTPTQTRQSRALIKVFTDAVYTAGGFNPYTSTAYVAKMDMPGSANSWDIYREAVGETPAVGTLLADDTYRAYVWVQDSFVPSWIGPDFITFQVSDPPSVATYVSPPADSIVNTGVPTLTASITAQAGGGKKYAQFQVASDDSFTVALQTLNSPSVTSGNVSVTVPTSDPLEQQNWTWRVRTINDFGTASAWTTARDFTVLHQPTSALWSPSLGSVRPYGTGDVVFTWAFNDTSPVDSQTAYQLRIWKITDTTTYTYDSGIVVSTASTATVNLDVTHKDLELFWQVQVRDEDLVWSEWSPQQAFGVADAPTVTITAPSTGAVVTTSTPTVAWSVSATAGRVQEQYRVLILDHTNADTVMADTGWITGVETSYQFLTPVVGLVSTYYATVQVIDTFGVLGEDTNSFTAAYTLPDTVVFTLDVADYATTGGVTLDWTTAVEDGNFFAWRVYRRNFGDTAWTLVRQLLSGDQTWVDYLSPNGVEVEYTVAQVVSTFGLYVETAYDIQQTIGESEKYFIVCPDDPTLNLCLFNVKSDNFSNEVENAVLNIVGRGRRVEWGDDYGRMGSLSAMFYDTLTMTAREQRLAMENLQRSGFVMYLRNSFGDVWQIAVMNVAIDRLAGVGQREYASATIDYKEITA